MGETDQPAAASAAFADAKERLAELREYVSFYLAAKSDAFKLSVRNAVFYAVLGVVGLLAGAAAIVTAVVLLIVGIADGIGSAFGRFGWLGDIIIGVAILGLIALGAKVALSKVFGASRKAMVEKYESRKHNQRQRFGRDIDSQA